MTTRQYTAPVWVFTPWAALPPAADLRDFRLLQAEVFWASNVFHHRRYCFSHLRPRINGRPFGPVQYPALYQGLVMLSPSRRPVRLSRAQVAFARPSMLGLQGMFATASKFIETWFSSQALHRPAQLHPACPAPMTAISNSPATYSILPPDTSFTCPHRTARKSHSLHLR